jgi:stearoyl-CoA desaturase (delta-9 desaturase)
MQQRKLDHEREKVQYGKRLERLPSFTWDEIQRRVQKNSEQLIVIDGYVYDVKHFVHEHPGSQYYNYQYVTRIY